ncbi:MAG TPA: 1-phosphofructokinase [Caldanaerobacter subterraneus]|uniref:Tagatose-6-phosphate kinase n=1 Tax=Caldanaerobacter subterraneus TaxID=911092 RepID=A0A357VQA5_9THEO|nr:1-phosphofructokinase [Caldanaerobacter subterraneus]HBT50389.1 1-phosphofructokinase [Caldanaerobacter subterraneus]
MITTVTVNPAIDRTVIVENLRLGSVNRVIRSRVDAGGKGINVAKNLKNLGDEVIALGFLGPNAQYIIDCLEEEGIKSDFVRIKNDTRTNIKISDILKGEVTDLNEYGPEVSKEEIELLKESIFKYAEKSKVLVLSGSLPLGVPKTFYKEIIKELKNSNLKIILDADNQALFYGIEEKPFMIKPNVHELEDVVGKRLETLEEIIEEGKKLNKLGIKIVAISMGSKGSVVITDDAVFRVKPLKVEVKGTVGAGDAYVAGFAHGIYRGLSLEETIKIAAALSTSVVMKEGTRAGTIEEVNALKDKIEIEKIER